MVLATVAKAKKWVYLVNDMCKLLQNCPANILDNDKDNIIKLEDVAQD